MTIYGEDPFIIAVENSLFNKNIRQQVIMSYHLYCMSIDFTISVDRATDADISFDQLFTETPLKRFLNDRKPVVRQALLIMMHHYMRMQWDFKNAIQPLNNVKILSVNKPVVWFLLAETPDGINEHPLSVKEKYTTVMMNTRTLEISGRLNIVNFKSVDPGQFNIAQMDTYYIASAETRRLESLLNIPQVRAININIKDLEEKSD